MNHQLIISNQLKLVLLSSCRLPCGRIIFQSFVIPLFHVFVFPGCISSSWRSRCFCSLLFWWFSLFKRCIISVQSFRRSLARRRCSHVLKVSAAVVLKRQNYWSSSGESRCEAAVLTRQENNSFFMFSYADGLTGFSSIEVKQFREALDVKTSGFRFNWGNDDASRCYTETQPQLTWLSLKHNYFIFSSLLPDSSRNCFLFFSD